MACARVFRRAAQSADIPQGFLIRDVSGRWHGHPYELVNRLCGINVEATQSHGNQFLLLVPIFVKVSHMEYHPEHQRV